MAFPRRMQVASVAVLMLAGAWAPLAAQAPQLGPGRPVITRDYLVGPQDVLNITSHDDPSLTGKFTVEADLTFTFPLHGRIRAGGMTLRAVETEAAGAAG